MLSCLLITTFLTTGLQAATLTYTVPATAPTNAGTLDVAPVGVS